MYRLDGGQRTLTFRDNAAAAEAFAAAIKAHGILRALAMHGYELRNEPSVEMNLTTWIPLPRQRSAVRLWATTGRLGLVRSRHRRSGSCPDRRGWPCCRNGSGP